MKTATGRHQAGQVRSAGRSRAFTLIELLIVIVIIAVVIAIVFPALGGARNAAKKAGTQTMFHDLGSATGQFILDNRRAPGYFTPTEMGDAANLDRGFTGMNNVMLDLAGGMVAAATGGGPIGAGPATVLRVGPLNDTTKLVSVDTTLIGTQNGGSKSYWMPDRKMFQVLATAYPSQVSKVTNQPAHRSLPDVVDPFGQPILAWTKDTTAPNTALFANMSFDPSTPQRRAGFYWASNAAFLKATRLGKLAQDQTYVNDNKTPHSLIGLNRGDQEILASMAGILGNPAYPSATDASKPDSARGTMIFHSAGSDGFYVGSSDRGGKLSGSNTAPYRPWSVGYNSIPRLPNQPQEDIMDRFDDILGKGDGSGG